MFGGLRLRFSFEKRHPMGVKRLKIYLNSGLLDGLLLFLGSILLLGSRVRRWIHHAQRPHFLRYIISNHISLSH